MCKVINTKIRRVTLTFFEFSHKSYLWDFRSDGNSEEIHGHVHTSHHENEQAMTRVAMSAQALLEEVKQMMFLKINNPSYLFSNSSLSTYTSYSSVCDEPCCQASHKASNLQGTHVGAACEQHSARQHTPPLSDRKMQ